MAELLEKLLYLVFVLLLNAFVTVALMNWHQACGGQFCRFQHLPPSEPPNA